MSRLAWVLFFWCGATALSAQGWCTEQRSLMDSVATLAPGYSDEPLIYLGGTEIQLVVGQIDAEYMFTGTSIAQNGSETGIELQLNTGGPAFFQIMSRAPPQILNTLQPYDRFVGLVLLERPLPGQDVPKNAPPLFHVSETECTKGFELSPTPKYVETLKLCLTTGRCRS